jgi:DNA-binding MarR family transcriptional regulator
LDEQDHELAILENIYRPKEAKPVRQRDLAQVVGISLGMTNVILKKLAQKGLVAIRKINSRNIQYVVTPSGIDEITRRSYRFLKRTVRNVVYYKEVLDARLIQIKENGFTGIVLVGKSDFDFVLMHLCQKHKLEYMQSEEPVMDPSRLNVLGEDSLNYSLVMGENKVEGSASLRDILIGL